MDFLRLDIFHLSLAVAFIAITAGMLVFSIRRVRLSRTDRESDNYIVHTLHAYLRLASMVIVSVLLAVALLGPLSPWNNISEREGSEIVWILDVSRSMDVRDTVTSSGNTSRLTRAKEIIAWFMTAHPENRYGLVIFAGESRMISPLTSSIDSLLTFLGSIDSGSISEWGSDFEKVLSLATERFTESGETVTRGFILLSDGWDKEDAPDTTVIRNIFHGKNLELTTIGLWSDKGGPIPLGNDLLGNPTYKQYEGETVVSARNEANLRTLADIGGGKYLSGDADESDIASSLSRVTRRMIRSATSGAQSDIGRWLVIAAFPFFLFSLVPSRRLKNATKKGISVS